MLKIYIRITCNKFILKLNHLMGGFPPHPPISCNTAMRRDLGYGGGGVEKILRGRGKEIFSPVSQSLLQMLQRGHRDSTSFLLVFLKLKDNDLVLNECSDIIEHTLVIFVKYLDLIHPPLSFDITWGERFLLRLDRFIEPKS